MKTWKIAPLLLGTGPRFKCFITYLKNPEARVEIAMIAWFVFNDDERIIIDTGPSSSTNTAKFHKPVMQTPEQNLEMQLKRWRYALPTTLYSERCLVATGLLTLVFAGDAFGGPRVEGAALSGLATATLIALCPNPTEML